MPATSPALVTDPPAGPDVEASELLLEVGGMHCAGCAASVQRALESDSDVESATVSVADGRATVLGTRGRQLDADRVVAAVRSRGFEAKVLSEIRSTAERRSEIELRQARQERLWRLRAIVALGVWVPMMLLHWVGGDASWVPWALLVGASIALATAGGGFYRSALRAAARRTTNMDTLIAIGATTAYVFSAVVLLAGLDQPLYFSEAAALLGIISLGHWLEARASARAGSAVRELLMLQPEEAEILDDGERVRRIPSAEVRPGDRMLIRPGARIPVDGVVGEGESEVDEAVVTGESVPVLKQVGTAVVAGSMNGNGRLVVEASVDGRHTTIARVADLVERAQSSKADIQRLADRVCAVFVPAVLAIAATTMLGWWLLAGDPATGTIATVTVLIISCPCALGLATPMAVMVGSGSASRRGILIKSAHSLELAGRARRVIFDKTGTLTVGRPRVTGIERSRLDEAEVLALAAAVESASEHPIARAIVDAATARGIEPRAAKQFRALPGVGVRGVVDGRTVEVLRDEAAACRVVVDGDTVASLTVVDEVRADAAACVAALRTMGLSVTMLSGDRRAVAEQIGGSIGLEPAEIAAEVSPAGKSDQVAAHGAGTVMVGDGINDAAALAAADVGVAIASGTNIAIESADVVIPGDRVTAVAQTIEIARATLRTIRQNLFFAFLYNAAAIPVAALGLLGSHGPLIAAAAMGASDVTVIGNALRLKRRLDRSVKRRHDGVSGPGGAVEPNVSEQDEAGHEKDFDRDGG